jgi:hypothetical protein
MTMDPGEVVPLLEYSTPALLELVERIEGSVTHEHFIYREAELDDLIRQVEGDLQQGEAADLRALLQAAIDAHNLVANEDPRGAAARLRSAVKA